MRPGLVLVGIVALLGTLPAAAQRSRLVGARRSPINISGVEISPLPGASPEAPPGLQVEVDYSLPASVLSSSRSQPFTRVTVTVNGRVNQPLGIAGIPALSREATAAVVGPDDLTTQQVQQLYERVNARDEYRIDRVAIPADAKAIDVVVRVYDRLGHPLTVARQTLPVR